MAEVWVMLETAIEEIVGGMASTRLKAALQVLLIFIVILPSEQSASPLQLEKVEPEAGVAVRATAVPDA